MNKKHSRKMAERIPGLCDEMILKKEKGRGLAKINNAQ